VQETLNAMLDAEANLLCNAQRYERSAERKDTRTESYRRKLHTRAGQVKIAVPKLRALPFETAIIERIHAQENREEAVRKAGSVAKKLEVMKLGKAARLRHIAGTKWGLRQYLKMDRLEEQARELVA